MCVGVVTIIGVLGAVASVRVVQHLWPPLGNRADALQVVLSVVCAMCLSLLACARIPFDLRWGLVGLPAGLLLLPALDSAGPLIGVASVLGGMCLGQTLRSLDSRRALSAHPELHLRRLVLPMTVRASSPLYREPSVERALSIASRRSWITLAIVALFYLVPVGVGAAWTYRPSLQPTLDAFREAWKASDATRVASFMHPSQQEHESAYLERATAELRWAAWPPLEVYWFDDTSESAGTVFLAGSGPLRAEEVWLQLPGATVTVPPKGSDPETTVSTSWVFSDGRWFLLTLGLPHAR